MTSSEIVSESMFDDLKGDLENNFVHFILSIYYFYLMIGNDQQELLIKLMQLKAKYSSQSRDQDCWL